MFGLKHSEETLEKMSSAKAGKKLSLETRAKITYLRGEKHPIFGKTLTQETKDLIRAARLGKYLLSEKTKTRMSEMSGIAIKVFDLKTNETSFFSSMKKAAEMLDVSQPALSFRFKTNNSFLLKKRYQIEKVKS